MKLAEGIARGEGVSKSNRARIDEALGLLGVALKLFIEKRFASAYGGEWADQLRRERREAGRGTDGAEDPQVLLKIMTRNWNAVSRPDLGLAERALVSELLAIRNRCAHYAEFSNEDAFRALDTAHRLLSAISAEQATEIEKLKLELLRELPSPPPEPRPPGHLQGKINDEIRRRFREAEKGGAFVGIISGDVAKQLGLDNRMPSVCGAMRNLMEQADEILAGPPKGNGTTLKIRYRLPRSSLRFSRSAGGPPGR